RAIAELKGQNPAPAFFSEDDVADLYDRFNVVGDTGWFSPIPGYEVSLRSAGHMPGAAMILIKFPDGKRWIHACDLQLATTELTLGATIQEDFLNPDGMTIESTYGARSRELPERAAHEDEFEGHVRRGLARGGFVLIPSFATTGLNMAKRLARVGIPVKMDGALTKNCADVYLSAEPWCPNDRPFSFNDLPTLSGVGDGGNKERYALLDGPPCAIVCSSGMIEGGPSVFYTKALAPALEPRNMIIITGYQAEASQGRKLLALQRGETITFTNEWINRRSGKLDRNSETVAVNAEVIRMQLSGHSDARVMAPWIVQINPKHVVTVHGDEESHQGMKEVIRELNPRINVVPGSNGCELEF
ncbi:MAG: MBL fold metallo-hydrolase, partial [bacterium]|nr:MBL fold metallo-hydrolase [bacterium]